MNTDKILEKIKTAQRNPRPLGKAAEEAPWHPLPGVDGVEVQYDADGAIQELRSVESVGPDPDDPEYAEKKARADGLALIKQAQRNGNPVGTR